jgi:hypothetical protein
MKYTTLIETINYEGEPINRKLSAAINKFFKNHKYMLEGCVWKKNFNGADYALIIESSNLYEELNYGYSDGAIYAFEELGIPIKAWEVHTKFHEAFRNCGFHPEMMNSCVVGFYKD